MADRYLPRRPNGKRVPGWEDVNITLLASDMEVSYRFLLGVLTGHRNTTILMLQNAASCLEISLAQLIERMERSCGLKILEVATAPGKEERRRQRSERRAIQAM